MRSTRVESSVILSVGYDDRRHILQVRFRNGRTYYYLAVPPSAYAALMSSPSVGRYFNEIIRPSYRAVAERDLRRHAAAAKRR